ncbi:MAG: hypothetical protein ACKO96_14535, partial [Flammeovirgaceae bacterium]
PEIFLSQFTIFLGTTACLLLFIMFLGIAIGFAATFLSAGCFLAGAALPLGLAPLTSSSESDDDESSSTGAGCGFCFEATG